MCKLNRKGSCYNVVCKYTFLPVAFPYVIFFCIISEVESKKEFIHRVREVVSNLPRSVVIVLRYLFAFLNQ